MRLIIAGKRDFSDKEYIYQSVDAFVLYAGIPDEIIEGGAEGVDRIAKAYAKERGYAHKEFTADWQKYGRSAGPRRNAKMADYAAKDPQAWLLAFWDGKSPGTKSMIREAEKAGIKIRIISLNKGEK